ncbi:hypothetical protein FQN54_004679 [Arachnomyces sp. PD_36]|nr:hypothetical protein FQN54_004679 [Arachnomyces sp. PD_36]
MGLFEKLQSKIELYRLEQRYTRRKNRTTFVGDVQYVDGEYVYNSSGGSSPTTSSATVSKHSTGSAFKVPQRWR